MKAWLISMAVLSGCAQHSVCVHSYDIGHGVVSVREGGACTPGRCFRLPDGTRVLLPVGTEAGK